MEGTTFFRVPSVPIARCEFCIRTAERRDRTRVTPTSLSRVTTRVSLARIGLDRVLNSRLYE
jgi:hypothetical protein